MGQEITCGMFQNVCDIAEYPDCGPGMLGLAETSLETRAVPTDLEEELVHSYVLHSLQPGQGLCCELTPFNRCRWQTYFVPQVAAAVPPAVEPPPVRGTIWSAAMMMNRAGPAASERKADPSMPWYAWPIGIGGFLLVLYSLMKAVTDSILPEELARREEAVESRGPRALEKLQQALELPPEQRGMAIPEEMAFAPTPERIGEVMEQMRQAEGGAFGSLPQETLREIAREIVVLKDSGALADVLVDGRVPDRVIVGLIRNMAFEGAKNRVIEGRIEERRKAPERKGFFERMLRRGGR